MIKAFDPIIYEDVDINTWLNQDDDNIIVILNTNYANDLTKNVYIALKKSYLFATSLNDTYVHCKFTNDKIFLPKESYKNAKTYFNLGYYINKKILIENKKIERLSNNKLFYITLDDKKDLFIKKEYIALSYIGIYNEINSLKKNKDFSPNAIKNTNKINKKNLPYDMDVYFEEILAKALKNYTYQWDAPINNYLRFGETYFTDSKSLFQYTNIWKRFGKSKEEAKEAIKNKIMDLDRAFLEAATINEDSKKIYWRGMKEPISISKIGEKIIIPNFFSISTRYDIAKNFSAFRDPNVRCCMYKIIIDKGVPIINMINTTKFKREAEYLLPRNLKYTITNILPAEDPKTGVKYGNYVVLQVSLTRPDQFSIKSNCKEYAYGIIKPIIDKKIINKLLNNTDQPKKIETKKVEPMNQGTKKIEPMNQKTKKRCPNGTRKDPKTGLCVSTNKNVNNDKTKKKRCPNGSRRNLITGECEKIQDNTSLDPSKQKEKEDNIYKTIIELSSKLYEYVERLCVILEEDLNNEKRNKTTLNNILKKLIIHKNLSKKDLLLKINKVSNELKTYYVNTKTVLTGILNKWELNNKANIYDEEYQEMGLIYEDLSMNMLIILNLEKVLKEINEK